MKELEYCSFKSDISYIVCKNNDIIFASPYIYKEIVNHSSPQYVKELLVSDNFDTIKSNLNQHNKIIFEWMVRCVFGFFNERYPNEYGYDYIKQYYIRYGIIKSLNINSKQTKTLLSSELSKTYHFLLRECEISCFDNTDLIYCYSDIFLTLTTNIYYQEGDVLVSSNNKRFLKKCISQFKPTRISVLNRTEYKEYTNSTTLYYVIYR